MYFYFLIIPSLVMLTGMLFALYKMTKHDRVLYRFCQIRRETMALLRKRGFSLPENDYLALKQLLHGLDITIHNYNTCKYTVFNYRYLTRKLEELKNETSKFKAKKAKTREIVQLTDKFRHTMIYAFLSYTPFLRSQWIIKFILLLLKILVKLGVRKFSTLADDLLWLNNQEFRNNHGDLRHA